MNKLETRELIRKWIEADNRDQIMNFVNLNPNVGNCTHKHKLFLVKENQ